MHNEEESTVSAIQRMMFAAYQQGYDFGDFNEEDEIELTRNPILIGKCRLCHKEWLSMQSECQCESNKDE